MDEKRIDEIINSPKLNMNDTFKFKCDMCGKCCKNRHDILLSSYDILRIRKFLNVSFYDFMDTYCEVYIGDQSKLPVVRLRPSAICVFQMQEKCLVNEVKPTVCALYPLGRIVAFDLNKYRSQYFLQEVDCGTKDKENIIGDWIKVLGEEFEECSHLWQSMVTKASEMMRKLPKMDEEHLEMLNTMLFMVLYDGYDYDEDFVSQFKDHLLYMDKLCIKAGEFFS